MLRPPTREEVATWNNIDRRTAVLALLDERDAALAVCEELAGPDADPAVMAAAAMAEAKRLAGVEAALDKARAEVGELRASTSRAASSLAFVLNLREEERDAALAQVAQLREATGATQHDRDCGAVRQVRNSDCTCHLRGLMAALSTPDGSAEFLERVKNEARDEIVNAFEQGFCGSLNEADAPRAKPDDFARFCAEHDARVRAEAVAAHVARCAGEGGSYLSPQLLAEHGAAVRAEERAKHVDRLGKGDAYDAVCRHLGITDNVLGHLATRDAKVAAEARAKALGQLRGRRVVDSPASANGIAPCPDCAAPPDAGACETCKGSGEVLLVQNGRLTVDCRDCGGTGRKGAA